MKRQTEGRRHRRQRELEAHRQAMLDGAIHLFATKGYFGARLEDVAEISEFSRSAIYQHYPGGKEQLYAEALDAAIRYRTEAVQRVLADVEISTVDEAIAAVWGAFCTMHEEQPDYVSLLGFLGYEDVRSVVRIDALKNVTDEGTRMFKMIDRAVPRGSVTGPDDRPLPGLHVAWSIWACFLGTVQFIEALAHVGYGDEAQGLLDSSLSVLLRDHATARPVA